MKVTLEDGNEIEVYSQEEFQAKEAEWAKQNEEIKTSAEAARKEADEAKAIVDKMRLDLADKTENIKRYRDMTEAEKEKLTAEQVDAIKRADAADARAAALEEKFNADIQQRVSDTMEKFIRSYAGDDKEIREKIEENMKLININGTDEKSIKQKVELAVNMMGESKPKYNPLFQMVNGDAPKIKEDFMDTSRAKEAKAAMGEIKF